MARILLTAFEPYDRWQENASWAAIMDLTRWYDGPVQLVTRRYPVDLSRMSQKLREDLQEAYDVVILCGQAPGSTHIRLENVGLNARSDGTELVPGAASAHTCTIPLQPLVDHVRASGIPARVSHHAGTYLCNAALYLSQHYLRSMDQNTPSFFVHMPLTPRQVANLDEDVASMSTPMVTAALAIMIQRLFTIPKI